MSAGRVHRTRPVTERLWARVAKGGPDDCWPWLGYCRQNGHGAIARGRRGEGLDGTHRVAWESANGPIPDGLIVRHTCDNPPCCNPAHLLVGTQADNIRDAVERGRLAREFRMPHTVLSDADVAFIRAHFWRNGYWTNSRELADRFGVSRDHITRIARGAARKVAA